MATWAENVQEEVVYDDGEGYKSEEEQQAYDEEDERRWLEAKVVTAHETDADGICFEITKKVIERLVERDTTAIDLRAKFAPFGKATGDQSALCSHEPPLVLEMGSADQFERESRNEVRRLINETTGVEVRVPDADLAIVERLERERKINGDTQGGSSGAAGGSGAAGSGGAAATWGAARGSRAPADHDSDVKRRIRITNVSDDVTEDNLRTIFSTNDCVVERVFLSKDRETGKQRGFAFITFRDSWMVEEAMRRDRYFFKNVVLRVSRAVENKR